MSRQILLVICILLAAAPLPSLAAPCEAYYPFDGSLNDASGNGYHGLMIPAENGAAAQFVEGRIGQALRVTGGNAMHSFVDLHYEFCPKITITAWFRIPSVAASGNQYVFSTGAGAGPGLYLNDGAVRVNGTGNGIYYPNAVRSADMWWFVAAVYDYENKTYHLDWRSRVTPAKLADALYAPENAFWVGTYNDDMSYTAQDLYVDDLRIHAAALTTEEIRAIAIDGNAP